MEGEGLSLLGISGVAASFAADLSALLVAHHFVHVRLSKLANCFSFSGESGG